MHFSFRTMGGWALTALCLASLAACTRTSDDYATADVSYEVATTEETGGASPQAAAPSLTATAPPGQRAPVLIRRAEMEMRVDDYAEAAAAVPGLVGQFDAYLAGEREWRTGSRVSNTLTVRVAAAQFDALLAALTGLAAEVDRREVMVDDVTEEFVDLEARLRARRAVEAQYVALLGRANAVTDVIAVQKQLADVREEIERAEGRLRYLTDRAALSTVEVTLYEETPASLAGGSFAHDVADAFGAGWRGLLLLIVAFVTTWPLWLAAALALLGWRWWRARRPTERPLPHA